MMEAADVDPTASDMIEADVDPTASDMIEAADVDPTASDMIEADVYPTASDMMEAADVYPTASDMMEAADVYPTASDMIEAADALESHHAMRRGWRDVLLSLLLSISVCSLLVALLRASLSSPPTPPQRCEHPHPIVAKSVDAMMVRPALPCSSPDHRKRLDVYKHTRSRDRGTRYSRRRGASSSQMEGHALFPLLPTPLQQQQQQQVDSCSHSPSKRHAHFA